MYVKNIKKDDDGRQHSLVDTGERLMPVGRDYVYVYVIPDYVHVALNGYDSSRRALLHVLLYVLRVRVQC